MKYKVFQTNLDMSVEGLGHIDKYSLTKPNFGSGQQETMRFCTR